MAPPPSLEAFNAPSREVCSVRRERTNTPLQALVTLNDVQFVEAARKLAELVLKENGSDNDRVMNAIAMRVLSRPFSEVEMTTALKTFADLHQHYVTNPDDAKALLAFGESAVDASLDPTTLAAWTMTCNGILNLDEALTK